MIKLLAVLLVLCLSVGLALYSFGDTNYVVIGAGQWVVRTSFTVFLGALVILFVPLYLLVRTLFAIWRSPRTFRAWRRQRKDRNAQATLNHGLTLLVEGRWRGAERELLRAVEAGANPVLGYIAAARAAQVLGAHERRDEHLRSASDAQPGSSVAVGLTQAELHLDDEQREQALATLLQLRAQTPNHERILALLRRLFEELRDWKNLLELLPALKQRRVISVAEFKALERRAICGLLVQSAASDDPDALGWRWSTVPKALKNDGSVLGVYTELMIQRTQGSACEALLRASLNKSWDQRLVRLYGRLRANNITEQLKRAETWLESREDDAVLLECLGRLCMESKLWGKARSYLDASVAIDPHPETFAALVKLLDQLDDHEAAGQYARRGLDYAATRPSFLEDIELPRAVSTKSLTVVTSAPGEGGQQISETRPIAAAS